MTVNADREAAGAARGPWGPGMTLLFGGILFLAYSVAQGVAMIPLMVLEGHGGVRGGGGGLPPVSGLNLAVGTSLACPVMLVGCALLVLARRGPPLAEYLALHPLRPARLAGWVVLMEAVALGFSNLNEWMDRPAPEFVASAYASAGHLPFFWSAIALCAPVAEEVLFRGFLFPGWMDSRLGRVGTVGFTSLAFMLVHGGQYDWLDLVQIGAVGLALGLARVRSGSLLAPLAMHVALNLTSLCLFALHLAQSGG